MNPSGQSQSLRASASGSPMSSPRKIFPGFLSSPNDDGYAPYSDAAGISPSSPDPPSTLPYLRTQSLSNGHTPPRKAPPAPLDLQSVNRLQSSPSKIAGPSNLASSASGTGRSPGRTLSSGRRRPSPLQLDKSKSIGLDEELQEQRDLDGPMTDISIADKDGDVNTPDSLNEEMNDLSLLRASVRKNLIARPLDSPLAGSDSGASSGALTPEIHPSSSRIPDEDTIPITDVIDLLSSASASRSAAQTLVLDTRPLGEFLVSHLPRSANMSIPSLIFKRFRKASGAHATSWNSLGSFVSTPAGKEVWANADPKQRMKVVVLGFTAMDETARILRNILAGMLEGNVQVVRGGWAAVLGCPAAVDMLVSGEESVKPIQSQDPSSSSVSLPPPRTTPAFTFEPPPMSDNTKSPPRVAHHPSMPSLRSSGPNAKRNVPSLAVQTGSSSRRPPKLSLNLDKPLRSATFGSFQRHQHSDTLYVPSQQDHSTLSLPKSPVTAISFQAMCHEQSKLPPSPSSFAGVNRSMGEQEDLISPVAGSGPDTSWSSQSIGRPDASSLHPSPATPFHAISGSTTARTNSVAPFIVSTILPQFLYLGPEISSTEEVDMLCKLGIKRILNVAIECEDDEDLKLRDKFERYMKVPMRDIVEESGMGKGIRDACQFLDDARLHSAPTYVHCKAGKSRSVTVVLAYLIHANAWTLKTAYAYVAERRKGISPNIGFVAELMQFEEAELGLKQSGGVHGESQRGTDDESEQSRDADESISQKKGTKHRQGARHMRESLPPAWAASLDSGMGKGVLPPSKVALHGEEDQKDESDHRRKGMGDDREVRKNGQWVHHRRAPVDRTTLQPGRRVSKAGLESLRPLVSGDSTTSPQRSPRPSPKLFDGSDKPHTPAAETRIGWV